MLHRKDERECLFGNWEEPGVRGTRIEIDRSRVLILWLNSPVLESPYTVDHGADNVLHIRLRKTGLRYAGAAADYAAVTSLDFADGALRYGQLFPISGPSETILRPTENSRYGNFTVVDDEVLPLLQGEWVDEGRFHTLRFRADRLTVDGRTIPIHALRSNSGYPAGCTIVDADPSKSAIGYFCEMRFQDGVLTATIPVCDAPSVPIVFRKA